MTDTVEHTLTPTNSLRPKLPGEEQASSWGLGDVELPFNDVSSDNLPLIVFFVVVGIVFFAIRLNSSKDRSSATTHSAPVDQTVLKKAPSEDSPKRALSSFDAKTAKHLPARKVLQGTAWVTDGDTIVINKTQIRLFGIDAPEIDHPYGQKAKWAMVKLCKGHKVQAIVTEVDAYGRTVAHCTLPDGRDLSAELVKMGLAIDWPKFSGGKYGHLEIPDVRKKLWLADARQKGRMHVWERFENGKTHTKTN